MTTMKQFLLSLPVHGKKDLVLVRQRTRQLAALLGYGTQDQALLAAGVFDLACQMNRRHLRATWQFVVEDGYLRICPADGTARAHIEKRLPENTGLSDEDIVWVAGEMCRLAPLDVFGELQRLNQEFLRVLLQTRSVSKQGSRRSAA